MALASKLSHALYTLWKHETTHDPTRGSQPFAAQNVIPTDAEVIRSGHPSQPARDRSIPANTSDRLHRRHGDECTRRRCNRSSCREESQGSPSRRSRMPQQRRRIRYLSCTVSSLLKIQESSWLPPFLENQPAVESRRSAMTTSAGFYPEVRRRSFDRVAKPDLLVGDESRQSYSVRRRREFARALLFPTSASFSHAVLRLHVALAIAWYAAAASSNGGTTDDRRPIAW
jgi:hypothetical protein